MKKDYSRMTLEELRDATKEFDQPWTGPGLPGEPMTVAERKTFEAWRARALAARKDRKRHGYGARRVQVSIERSLLARIDTYARYHGMTRASILAMGGELFLNAAVRAQPSRP